MRTHVSVGMSDLEPPFIPFLQGESVEDYRRGYRCYRQGSAKGAKGEVRDIPCGKTSSNCVENELSDSIFGSSKRSCSEFFSDLTKWRLGYRAFRRGEPRGSDGFHNLEKFTRKHLQLLPVAALGSLRASEKQVWIPNEKQGLLHVHFGAGKLGFGLIVPAIVRSRTKFVIFQRPSPTWEVLLSKCLPPNPLHNGPDTVIPTVEVRVNAESIVELGVISPLSHPDGVFDFHNHPLQGFLIIAPNDHTLVTNTAGCADSASTALGPFLEECAEVLAKSAFRKRHPLGDSGIFPIFCCENDHDAMDRLAEKIKQMEIKVLSIGDLVDQHSVFRSAPPVIKEPPPSIAHHHPNALSNSAVLRALVSPIDVVEEGTTEAPSLTKEDGWNQFGDANVYQESAVASPVASKVPSVSLFLPSDHFLLPPSSTSQPPLTTAATSNGDSNAFLSPPSFPRTTLVIHCMVDRICSQRVVEKDAIKIEAEPFKGEIVVMGLPANATKPPFAGENVRIPRLLSSAKYFANRKILMVNGLHTVIAFMSLVKKDKERILKEREMKKKHSTSFSYTIGDIPLLLDDEMSDKEKRMFYCWMVGRVLLVFFEHDLNVIMNAHNVKATPEAVQQVLDYAHIAATRISTTPDSVKRVLGGGVKKRFEDRLVTTLSVLQQGWHRHEIGRIILKMGGVKEKELFEHVESLVEDAKLFL
eukprot:GDKJ01017242.1.p1 GENE.GDKJ01017242.1~~GDKJ01017242.1.p1  ORF type:complete len:697 (+),score=133.97 GDKJ01017242.1:1-2091(+)